MYLPWICCEAAFFAVTRARRARRRVVTRLDERVPAAIGVLSAGFLALPPASWRSWTRRVSIVEICDATSSR